LELRHLGKGPPRLLKCDPDQAVTLLRPEGRHPRLRRYPRRVLKLRYSDAPAVTCVSPAVIGANKLVAADPAKRKCGPPVHAQVGHGPWAAWPAPEDKWLAEQVRADGPVGKLGSEGHWMPARSQRLQIGEDSRTRG